MNHEPGGDVLYWMRQDPGDGRRLWKTSGEPGLWSAVSPDTLSVIATTQSPALVPYRGDLYFVGKVNGESSWGLWRTDGESTALVSDVFSGAPGPRLHRQPDPVEPHRFRRPSLLHGLGGGVRERALGDGGYGRDDGVRRRHRAPGGQLDPRLLTPVGDLLFFVGNDGTSGAELWRTDGTQHGTFLVADLCSDDSDPYGCGPQYVADARRNSSAPSGLTAHDGKLYFSAYDTAHGRELFRSDGQGVELVEDFFPALLRTTTTGGTSRTAGSPVSSPSTAPSTSSRTTAFTGSSRGPSAVSPQRRRSGASSRRCRASSGRVS